MGQELEEGGGRGGPSVSVRGEKGGGKQEGKGGIIKKKNRRKTQSLPVSLFAYNFHSLAFSIESQ